MASESESEKRPRGILKKPKSGSVSSPPSSGSPRKSRAEAERIAIQHAKIIQQQKDLQLEIFEAINTLCDFPLQPQGDVQEGAEGSRSSSSSARAGEAFSAAHPAPADAARFKALVRAFQPSDYDDLIEERNILGRCGYALCARPRRLFPDAGEFKLVHLNRPDFRIARRAELERWCSDACARRALYIKVQLNETPAWERVGMPSLPIDLLDEQQVEGGQHRQSETAQTSNKTTTKTTTTTTTTTTLDDDLARRVGRLKMEEGQRAAGDSAALALERGDVDRLAVSGRSINVTIREKNITSTPVPPSAAKDGAGTDGHLVLEGHKTTFRNAPEAEKRDTADD